MNDERPTLYVLPGSHPCAAVEEAMRRKGIAFRRVDLLPLFHMVVGAIRYGGVTVPGMRLGNRRVVGSREIMRVLDEIEPDPPLLPEPGSADYARVLEAERWGDVMLQDVPRRVLDAAFLRRPDAIDSFAQEGHLPLPASVLRPSYTLVAKAMAMRNHANDANVRADLAALPAQLDRIDAMIAEGLIGGAQPNAADLQIGSSIRLLMSVADVRPLIEGRPCARLADYFPPQTSGIPAHTLPPEWIPAPAAA
ncbi:MAG TPA: glutathione S-transferase N-terminal domain-containing protein [Solirubrobacteraceae bacterium]|nr:glutathione S-transferase N-terminal domain-containing protein [Solirubrobacteraceae bacterium]